jgi:signal peptidase I
MDKINYQGKSMSPFLKKGDVLLYEPLQRFQIGDIVVFHDGDSKEITAHRCVKKDLSGDVVVKGDRNLNCDNFIHSHYIGRVVQVERAGKLLQLSRLATRQRWIAFFSFHSLQEFSKIRRYVSQALIQIICF